MQTRSLFCLLAGVAFILCASTIQEPVIAQQNVLGPEFAILQQKPEYKHKEMVYCHDYFVREPITPYTQVEYVVFHYRDDKTIVHNEISIKDLTVMIVVDGPDKTLPSSGPKARMATGDDGRPVWKLVMDENTYQQNIDCLTGIQKQ